VDHSTQAAPLIDTQPSVICPFSPCNTGTVSTLFKMQRSAFAIGLLLVAMFAAAQAHNDW
jgi:hypothetical protein